MPITMEQQLEFLKDENQKLNQRIIELQDELRQVRNNERELFDAYTQANDELETIKTLEEEMILEGRRIDPLKGNYKQQVVLMNQREAAELAAV